jgi:hypothetical protein
MVSRLGYSRYSSLADGAVDRYCDRVGYVIVLAMGSPGYVLRSCGAFSKIDIFA